MKIIGAGFGRTGTASLKFALEQLGFGPCYHMIEVIRSPSRVKFWQTVANGEKVDWQEHFKDFQSTVDFPACNFYKELMKIYPDAKVLLSVRDPERWYDSTLETIYYTASVTKGWRRYVLPPLARFTDMVAALIWDGLFDGKFEDRAHAIAVYNRHNEEVKRHVPPEKLLVFNVKDGWKPLCSFLGVPVPEGKPFPHLNDRNQTRAFASFMRGLTVAIPIILLVLLVWLVWVLVN